MFDNERYITKGINESIPIQQQMILWNLIDDLKKRENHKIDYLQVFELKDLKSNKNFSQEIIHKQEVESYKKMYLFSNIKPINAKVYVIDDSEQSVMMLTDEY